MDTAADRCYRPLAFDKMEALVREMQDPENGVPVRSQKVFLTSIPSAFMGYDLIEWLMERLGIEESEALNIANQLCQYGYFFPINDSKNLVVKDDSSLYRFQSPYYWPWQQRTPDNVEYAIYLAKRTLRNKQRHGLEEYEQEALTNLRKNLQNKWDYITLQAEEQVKLAKERKKGDKIVSDSQERAYWRVYRPPPGFVSSLEQCPVPNRNRNGFRQRRRTLEDCRREVELLKNSLTRTRVKVSQALESMIQYVETYAEYDPLITGTQPSNPWVTEDMTYWHINNPYVDIPTEKRVRRWALSMEELVSDATGLHEFTTYLRKEYSHENIRFWMAVNDLRRSSQSQIQRKVQEIFEEFLAPGAPCEINIDGKTMEKVHQELRQPSRFTFDAAAEHVYTLLLKKDCYPRFIRSEQYKMLLASAKQPSQKKRFFNFGPAKKKVSTSSGPAPSQLQQAAAASATATPAVGCGGALSRRRGSDRSLSGSAHELAVCGVRDTTRVPHSHSQSNLSDIPYREPEPAAASGVCPWDEDTTPTEADKVKKPSIAVVPGSSTSEDVYPWEPPVVAPVTTDRNLEVRSRKNSGQLDSGSSSSDISLAIVEVSDRSSGLGQQMESAEKRGSTQQQQQSVTAPQRKLSTVSCGEPVARRASVSAMGVQQLSDTSRPSVSSFEECSSSLQPPSELVLSSDIDNAEEPAARKKSPGLRKACSVGPASAPAPTISVSSALDDTSTPSIPSATMAPSSGQAPLSSSPPPPLTSPLAPLAVPDSESPASEWAPDLEEEFAARAHDPAPSEAPPPTLTPPSSPPPDATTDANADAAAAASAATAGEPNHPATADGKQTDICPWEDE